MVITFYGEGCFKIQSKETTILTDPFASSSGLTTPRFKSDIIIKTLTALPFINQPTPQEPSQQIIGPGEYNIKDADIIGFGLIEESAEKFIKTIYLVKIEDIKLCFLGHISKTPEPNIMKYLEEIDILFIPAGGKPFLEQKLAAQIAKDIEPKIVIPSFYKLPGMKRPAGDLKIFLEEINHAKAGAQTQEKLTIKKKDLIGVKKIEVITLKP